MLTAETAGRSLGSLNPSAREAFTRTYARRRCLSVKTEMARRRRKPDDGPGDTEDYESRCAAPMRTDDTQPEPADKGPVTK